MYDQSYIDGTQNIVFTSGKLIIESSVPVPVTTNFQISGGVASFKTSTSVSPSPSLLSDIDLVIDTVG